MSLKVVRSAIVKILKYNLFCFSNGEKNDFQIKILKKFWVEFPYSFCPAIHHFIFDKLLTFFLNLQYFIRRMFSWLNSSLLEIQNQSLVYSARKEMEKEMKERRGKEQMIQTLIKKKRTNSQVYLWIFLLLFLIFFLKFRMFRIYFSQ